MAALASGASSQKNVSIKVEFSGGLELLFGGKRQHDVSLPAKNGTGSPTDVDYLVDYLCKNLMTDERKDMFVLDSTVRPGILVLINDADWELEGEGQYALKPGDNILFVSTLHGG